MFRCDLCARIVPARTPAARVVLETRPKVYPFRKHANWLRSTLPYESRKVQYNDPGGTGHETVREAVVCPTCSLRR
jgi:hypothetical protein